MSMGQLITASFPPDPSLFWKPVFGDGAWAITWPILLAAASAVIITIWWVVGTKNLKVVPSKGQFFMEKFYEIPRNAIARDMIGERDFKKFLPLLLALFTFILLNNLYAAIPGIQYPTMSRIAFPAALTLVVYFVYIGIGLKKHGFVGYFARMIPAGVPGFVKPVLLVLEIVTYFATRPVTLAVRLFANMFAGHMLLIVFGLGAWTLLNQSSLGLQIASVAPFLLFIVMTFFELLVQFLQAYVFTVLAAFYIADALAEHH